MKAHDKGLLPHALALFPLPGMFERLLAQRDNLHQQVQAGIKTPSVAMRELGGMIRTPRMRNAREARAWWLNIENRELVNLRQRDAQGTPAAVVAARAAVVAQQARNRQAVEDRKLASMPHVQSPGGRSAVAAVMQKRDELQTQVATGELTAPEAKAELDAALTTGEGAAVAAQSPSATRAWQATSEQAIDATAQAATAQAVVAATPAAPSRGNVLTIALGAVGAGVGYASGENKQSQTTYAAVGGVAGVIVGCIVNKIRQRRAALAAAPPPIAIAATTVAPAAPAAPAEGKPAGVSGLWY